MGKKNKKKNPEKLAVYRIVDTKTLEVIYVGFTEELTKGTLGEMLKLLKKEAVNKGIALDSRYVLDYIPVKNKKMMFRECGNFRFWYRPVLNAFGDKDYPEITEEDNVKWKPFFSELHDGVVTNRNIIKALEKSGKVSVLKEFEWWNIMKAVFDSPETERALHTIGEAAANIAVENVFIQIRFDDDAEKNLAELRTAFIQLVNEKMEGKYKPLAVFSQHEEPEAEKAEPSVPDEEPEQEEPVSESLNGTETEQEETEVKRMNFLNPKPETPIAPIGEFFGFKKPETDVFLVFDEELEEEQEDEDKKVVDILEKIKAAREKEEAELNFVPDIPETGFAPDFIPEFLEDSFIPDFDDVPESTPEVQKAEESTVPEFQPVMQWGKITDEIGKHVPAYVKRTLVNSGAAYFGDTLLITAENPLFLTIFKKAENAKILSDTVAEVLGKPYKIRAKCTAEQNCFVNTEETEFVPADKSVIEMPSEIQPEPVLARPEAEIPDTANQSIAEKMKQAQKEHEIQKRVREAQWKMFFENCVGYYQKNSADFFVQNAETGTMISYHMPYFVSGCLVNGQRENLFFAIADNMDDYAVLFHISTLYGVKIMILHDVESETAIYAHGNEPEFMNSPETYAETPNMPQEEYQIQISETGRLFFTQQTAKTPFTEISFRFLHSGRELLESRIRNKFSMMNDSYSDMYSAENRIQEIDRKVQTFQEQQEFFRHQEEIIQEQMKRLCSEIS